jgi:hypothetical protein
MTHGAWICWISPYGASSTESELLKMDVSGKVRGVSLRYADGRERMYIAIDKREAGPVPHQDHARIEVDLVIGTHTYRAGIRTTPKDPYVWIGADLDQRTIRLVDVLEDAGFSKNQPVLLRVEGNRIHVLPA